MSLENEWPPASSLGEVQLSATELEPYLLAQERNGTITVNFAKSKLFNPYFLHQLPRLSRICEHRTSAPFLKSF